MAILYERILEFVIPRTPISHYKSCSTVTEMVTRLGNWPANKRIILVIDEADRLFQLDSSSFSVLLRLPEMVINLVIDAVLSSLTLSILFSWTIEFVW